MSTRTTSADLEQIVNVIRNATGRPYCLRTGYGKVGLSYEIGDKGGIRDVTGLMTKGELHDWINAYSAGIDEGRESSAPTAPASKLDRPNKLSKGLAFAVRMARFSALHNVDPSDVAHLIALAEHAFKAGEWNCNAGTEQSAKADTKAGEAFEEAAKACGFGVEWNGLWPTLTREGRDIYLPSQD